jgi:hypothetical protein
VRFSPKKRKKTKKEGDLELKGGARNLAMQL